MTSVRLVLLDVLNPDAFRTFRDEYYPFIQGYLRSSGIPAIRLFVPMQPSASQGALSGLVYEVASTIRRELIHWIQNQAATHVLVNERLSEGLFRGLQQELAGVSIRLVQSSNANEVGHLVTQWLGLPWPANQPVNVEEWIEGDYSAHVLNASEPGALPHIHLFSGPLCAYRRSLAKNPFFEGVDLTGVQNPTGCSFCGTGDVLGDHDLPKDPLGTALRQLKLAYLTANRDPGQWAFRIRGGAPVLHLVQFCEGLNELNAPPSEFFVSLRMDELLAAEAELRRAVALLRSGGHRLFFWNMGLENLSPTENERLNKGISPLQIRQAVALVRDFQQSAADVYRFTEFGFILFTPWTTLEDLRLNVSGLRELDLQALETFLGSSLLLLPHRAISALAQRDGLLVSDSDLFGLNKGCLISWDASVLPWRFRDPKVASIHRIMQRICPQDGQQEHDVLAGDLQKWREQVWPGQKRILPILEALIEAAEVMKQPTAEGLMERVARTRPMQKTVPKPAPKPVSESAQGATGPWGTLVGVLQQKPKPPLMDHGQWALLSWKVGGDTSETLELTLRLGSTQVEAVLEPVGSGREFLFKGKRFGVWYKSPKGALTAEASLSLRRLLVVAEKTTLTPVLR